MFLAVIGCWAATARPQVGQVPSAFIDDGAQYFAHSSHHGMPESYSLRMRTRNLIGVEPNSNASRMERSR